MLVEHTFITTLDGPDAIELAWGFLSEFGFAKVDRDDRSLHVSRGRPKPKSDLSVSDLPQAVRLEYDRGRVDLAVTVSEYKKVEAAHREMALSLVHGLEQMLAHDGDLDKARGRMVSAEFDNAERIRRIRRRRHIYLGVFAGFVFLLILLIIWAVLTL